MTSDNLRAKHRATRGACRLAAAALAVLAAACGGDQATEASSGADEEGSGGSTSTTSASVTSSAASTSTGGPGDADALRQRMAPWADQLTVAPFGPAAAITASDGVNTVTVAVGTLHDGGAAADEATRFNVASVSKVVTAARVVSLAHAGALSLEDAVADHLPGVALLDGDGVDRAGDVTLRDLVGHRGGLPHHPPDLEAKVDGRWSDPALLQLMTESWDIELVAEPGDFSYSNLGYALLAAVIERQVDCTFTDCMAPYLEELGLAASTFWPATLTEGAAHGRVESGGTVTFHPPGWYASRYAVPFTGLWTSMPDLARFGARLVAASRDAGDPLAEMTSGDGLGVIHSQRLGAASLEHDGSAPGFYAALVVVPERDVVVALATNGGNEAAGEVNAFTGIVDGVVRAVPSPP